MDQLAPGRAPREAVRQRREERLAGHARRPPRERPPAAPRRGRAPVAPVRPRVRVEPEGLRVAARPEGQQARDEAGARRLVGVARRLVGVAVEGAVGVVVLGRPRREDRDGGRRGFPGGRPVAVDDGRAERQARAGERRRRAGQGVPRRRRRVDGDRGQPRERARPVRDEPARPVARAERDGAAGGAAGLDELPRAPARRGADARVAPPPELAAVEVADERAARVRAERAPDHGPRVHGRAVRRREGLGEDPPSQRARARGVEVERGARGLGAAGLAELQLVVLRAAPPRRRRSN